jgi:hypothetical protein
MHYMTRRSHQMQKHKFGVTCPGTLIVESVPVSPKLEKYCVYVSRSRRIGMHYVTR